MDKLISMQHELDTFDNSKPKEKFVYFLEDGRTFNLSNVDLLNKSCKELEYVIYLLEEKNEVTKNWVKSIK